MIAGKEEIIQAKQRLGHENAEIIARLLNLQKYNPIKRKALCPWHAEETASFVYNPKTFSFHCFGCGKNTDVIDACMHAGATYAEAVTQLLNADIPCSSGAVPEPRQKVKEPRPYRFPNPAPLNAKRKVYEYLAKRGISKETIDAADVREDRRGNIVFHYYDADGVLKLVKYRPARKLKQSEMKMWCQKDADTTPLLFNMHRANPGEPLLIVEGEIEALVAIEAGYANTVSVPFGAGNCSWIKQNFEWLKQFSHIIVCADNDEAGIKMRKNC
ncbi:MAG: CHC2 zinc finger domain-containing protein, partial [Firmicutes bacterium]|nr:CHC2 zinc finger domain-containing protein [Bacillota bacterium]